MNKQFKAAQGGFTLIELIVVIVILGILAATALPKFTNLGGEARLASLNAAKGSLVSTAAMMHGKYLANPGSVTGTAPNLVMTVEGVGVEFDTATGYPKATANFALAAGLNPADYKPYAGAASATAATATTPAIGANGLSLVPVSVADTATGVKCYIAVAPAASSAAPVITVGGATAATVADCQ